MSFSRCHMGEIQWSTNINYVPALIFQPTVYSLGTAKNRGPAKFLGNRPGTVSGTVTGTGSPLLGTSSRGVFKFKQDLNCI